jgi:acetylornithine deacetylase/succinyl-diaminopimelate desuccinylase-like protein
MTADQRRESIAMARASVSDEELAWLCQSASDIPAPTGAERERAEFLNDWMTSEGLTGHVQLIDERQANLIVTVGSGRGGFRLLLLAPLDTAFVPGGEDAEWLGPSPRADFRLPVLRSGDSLIGLGAENPGSFAACALAAALGVQRAGTDLPGELVVALTGGSMPALSSELSTRRNIGLGAGTQFLLDHGPPPDAAIVLKPGYSVVYEEAGFAFFRVLVTGQAGYTGSRHKGTYLNPIVAAATVVTALEEWFGRYAAANTSGQVAPQGAVTAINGGNGAKPAFSPAGCELWVDLRISPRTSLPEVTGQLEDVIAGLRYQLPGFVIDVELAAWRPGSASPPDSLVVRRLVWAWEETEGRPHVPGKPGSGMSDGGVLRRYGIPTARIGLPPPRRTAGYEGFSMGVADVASMRRLTDVLLAAVIDLTGRGRAVASTEGDTRP